MTWIPTSTATPPEVAPARPLASGCNRPSPEPQQLPVSSQCPSENRKGDGEEMGTAGEDETMWPVEIGSLSAQQDTG